MDWNWSSSSLEVYDSDTTSDKGQTLESSVDFFDSGHDEKAFSRKGESLPFGTSQTLTGAEVDFKVERLTYHWPNRSTM